jgi:hypothetical protein
MPNLKRGDRVVAVYVNGDGEVRRGTVSVFTDAHSRYNAYAADVEGIGSVWLNFLYGDTEGVTWAKGWDTPAANALRVRVALLS